MVTRCIFKVQQPGLISQIVPFQKKKKHNCIDILLPEIEIEKERDM